MALKRIGLSRQRIRIIHYTRISDTYELVNFWFMGKSPSFYTQSLEYDNMCIQYIQYIFQQRLLPTRLPGRNPKMRDISGPCCRFSPTLACMNFLSAIIFTFTVKLLSWEEGKVDFRWSQLKCLIILPLISVRHGACLNNSLLWNFLFTVASQDACTLLTDCNTVHIAIVTSLIST
jgi:hypothetical protein